MYFQVKKYFEKQPQLHSRTCLTMHTLQAFLYYFNFYFLKKKTNGKSFITM
jgi:hypothetical protein